MENNHLIPINNLSKLIHHDYTFIDLRDTSQFNKLHITKFINIPYDQFINNPPKLSKNKPIYLICYTGTKSLSLAKKLSSLGYQAYSFSGGFYVIEHPINNQFYYKILLLFQHLHFPLPASAFPLEFHHSTHLLP